MNTEIEQQLSEACESVKHLLGSGKVADYIPALARVDANKFGAAIVMLNGDTALYGDAKTSFSIQSISKVYALVSCLNLLGDDLWRRIHHEPSGNPFNSIVQLELERGIPRNPFINAGAIVMSDILLQKQMPNSCATNLLRMLHQLSKDSTINVDSEVAQSELSTGHRNASLASFMKSFGNLNRSVSDVLAVYCNYCAIAMNCQQLARSLLFLANGGVDPLTSESIVSAQRARRINSIMMLCGHYDASGNFAFRVGLPGKSGVGGGIVAVVPNVGVICVWSPGLNASGNSLVGTAALEAIVNSTGWGIL